MQNFLAESLWQRSNQESNACVAKIQHMHFIFVSPVIKTSAQPDWIIFTKKNYSSINSKSCVISAVLASMIEAEQYFSADN